MRRVQLIVEPGGDVVFIHDDDVAAAVGGRRETVRASHVEPDGDGWTADLSPVNGPMLGPYPTRREALAAEVAWLEARMRAGPLEVNR